MGAADGRLHKGLPCGVLRKVCVLPCAARGGERMIVRCARHTFNGATAPYPPNLPCPMGLCSMVPDSELNRDLSHVDTFY
jgi:hypothetical protein